MAASSIVQNLTEEYLTCRICLHAYDRPRRLPCQHSFCADCIRQLITTPLNERKLDRLTCPLCRSDVTIPANVSHDDFVNNLPLDSLIVDLQTTLSRHDRNPEITPITNGENCREHIGRSLDHYCFHHARVICVQCIETFHSKGYCRCLPIKESYCELQPRIDRVLHQLKSQLDEAELGTIQDRSFEESKQKTLDDITDLERRINSVLETCKRQLSVLRSDVARLNREYIVKRKDFFTVVHSLLETTTHFEYLKRDKKYKNLIELLPIVESQLENGSFHWGCLPTDDQTVSLSFTLYDEVKEFIRRFTAIGFVELKGVKSALNTDFSNLQLESTISGTPPLSISHILSRKN